MAGKHPVAAKQVAFCCLHPNENNERFVMRFNLKMPFGLLFLFPTLAHAHAHAGGMTGNGWHDGFNHPLHGWDHLIVMLGVGWWAAQQRGRAVWLIPLTFVAV